MSTCLQPIKRRRTNYTNSLAKIEVSQDKAFKGMDLLADAIVRSVFEYLPPSYLLIAGVCHRFHDIYKDLDQKTSAEHLVQSVGGASLFVEAADPEELLRPASNSMIARPMRCTDFICDTAAACGNMEVLKWLLEFDVAFDNPLVDEDITSLEGHVTRDLVKQNITRYHQACASAAKNGHLKVLQWARENGLPWENPYLCTFAAMYGHLEVLQWAIKNGCHWSWIACFRAATNERQYEVAKWLDQTDADDGFWQGRRPRIFI